MSRKITFTIPCMILLIISSIDAFPQAYEIEFGKSISSVKIFSGSKEKDKTLKWINVNTEAGTWTKRKDILVCTGNQLE